MMERVALSAGRCGSECVEYSKILKKELKAMRVSKYALYTNIYTVDWNKKEKVEEWRSSWAEHANRYLENWKPISFFIT